MEENYDFEHGTTDAFNLYAEDVLLFDIDVKKYTGRELWITDSVQGEINFRKLISMYLSDRVCETLDWNKVKRDFNTRVAKTAFEDIPTTYPKYEKRLKSFGKLKYCTEILKSLKNQLGYDLDTSNYLLVIYYKLLNLLDGEKNNSPISEKAKQQLQNDNIYSYLVYGSAESFSSHVNYNELFDTPINKLINLLFEHIFIEQFEFANRVLESTVGTDEYGNILPIYTEIFVINDEMDSTTQAIQEAEKYFNIWLTNEMHILDNGMEF